jgi:hypothetical protein
MIRSQRHRFARVPVAALLSVAGVLAARGCGLDWSLPRVHFDGVEEHGDVAYWEKIADLDIGEPRPLPLHIGFNSHREASSSILGKGWTVALLESHVEPVDENTLHVIMPDGWTCTFLRNGNTETWRGNAGWAGETDGARFTIAAPCGWSLKFDGGRLQEIDGAKNGPLVYRYNGADVTEIDQADHALVQVERDTGEASALVIGDVRIEIAQAQAPCVARSAGHNLIVGLDRSLVSLTWNDGRRESFALATDALLNPTLTIDHDDGAPRVLTWDAATRQIISDGPWRYAFAPAEEGLRITRTAAGRSPEIFEADHARGVTLETGPDGHPVATYRFVNGPLTGLVRRIVEDDGAPGAKVLYAASYFPSGNLLRESFYPDRVRYYADDRRLLKETVGGQVDYLQELDDRGRVVRTVDSAKGVEVRRNYDSAGGQTAQVFEQGKLMLTELIDPHNRLVSLEEN